VDDRGRLFTWGRAGYANTPNGLGYELNSATECQLTPKGVDALSEHRVTGVALGDGFTLAVTDAGAIFSCGSSTCGDLNDGSLASEVLPRRIEALVETGRFVAVAAGIAHALALTEDGQVYGWGCEPVNSQGKQTPQLVAIMVPSGRVKLLYAHCFSSCAVTEKGELYTWGNGSHYNLGHTLVTSQRTPSLPRGG